MKHYLSTAVYVTLLAMVFTFFAVMDNTKANPAHSTKSNAQTEHINNAAEVAADDLACSPLRYANGYN